MAFFIVTAVKTPNLSLVVMVRGEFEFRLNKVTDDL
jgi:hypothetical protein